MKMVGLNPAMPLERRRVLILYSLASTTPGWPSLAPSSPQIRWTLFKHFYLLDVCFCLNDFGWLVNISYSRSLIKRWPSCRRSCKTPWRRRRTLCCTGMKLKSSEWGAYLLSVSDTNEWGNYLHSYSVASAGPSSEEDSMEHMELETRGIEMDSSNPSYKR